MRKLLNNSMNPKTTKLKDIMTSPVKVADKDDQLTFGLDKCQMSVSDIRCR